MIVPVGGSAVQQPNLVSPYLNQPNLVNPYLNQPYSLSPYLGQHTASQYTGAGSEEKKVLCYFANWAGLR